MPILLHAFHRLTLTHFNSLFFLTWGIISRLLVPYHVDFFPFGQFLLTILLCGRKTNILDMKHLVSLKLEFTQETHVSMTRVPRGGKYDVDKKNQRGDSSSDKNSHGIRDSIP